MTKKPKTTAAPPPGDRNEQDAALPPEIEAVEPAEAADPIAAELAEWQDRAARVQAEYENFRKRTQREREQLWTDVRADTVAALLPVYDNLKRAAAQPTQDAAYARGVEMTLQQWDEVTARFNLTPVGAVGETFDPNLHDAVAHVEDETAGPNTIVEVFSQGFRIGDKILRHAMVKVAN